MSRHEDFEQLCALEAIGQLSQEDHAVLSQHIGECAACRTTLQEMRALAQVLAAADRAGRRLSNLVLPRTGPEFRDEFLSRARREGIRLTAQSDKAPSFLATWPLNVIRRHYPAAALVACVVTIAVVLLRYQTGTAQSSTQLQTAEARIAELTREVSSLRQQAAANNDNYLATQQQADSLSKQYAAALEKIKSLEELLVGSQARAEGLQRDLVSARAGEAQFAQKLAEGARTLEQFKAELDSLHAVRAEDQALLAAEKRQVDDLSEKLRLQLVSTERERELLAAGKDIRDIMGARDLHIIDVHDFDVKGKRRKSFGRIFLTEGKSLIFYAFDLADPKVKNASFQAWGQREANNMQAINLGIFYADDQSQARWVLKFNNPDVLREIDSVFVTVEPPGGGRRPTGQKLLFAYLNTDANHP